MNLIRNILFPFVPLYHFVTWVRNKLYDWGVKKSSSYAFPVICVGNLSVGGTGKTPMIEYLINLLKKDYRVATLSRGYKRVTDGFQLANKDSNVETIGDEPFQFYSKFKNDVMVAVDADRNNGIINLKSIENSPEVILLDDAFQHRKIKAGLNILLTTYTNPYFNDFTLPTGNLREPKSGAKRADVIIVTKCPDDLNTEKKLTIIKKIKPKKHQQVFFSSIKYSNNVFSETDFKKINELHKFTLVTGIANAKPLVKFLKDQHLDFEHLNFKDHYTFTQNDIDNLIDKALIITTEKDFMRLKQYESLKSKLYYLPIEVVIDKEASFNKAIKGYLKN
ncbi:tetraacyldisaccharide 4'-kinase [Seonamhaeicola aphaedonensis]|uniref:Tetraacyldisaccharide 4'-kinase n=1 Tax=Seonamhaeicola aphaedonensis TaxID=1461338 RepID=A0A3D9HFN3_9FLAO|nr:tetraacyldisaccharide 4'-kinase [Seonamhaeicola aphaedonensis]RED48299.1 lipid-A-disaccharide kinase [Seonamhaeicola aphaedonensis]